MNKVSVKSRLHLWRWMILLAVFGCLLPPGSVLAHGGGELKAGNVAIGSYLVSVWVNPPTVQAGQVIHVTVGIADESSGEPILDAAVDVLIFDEAGEVVATAVATTEQSINRLFYEADLATLPTGKYLMRVVTTGNAGNGDLAFGFEVVPRRLWLWIGGTVVGLAVIALVVRSWRRGNSRQVRRRRTAVPRTRPVDELSMKY